ncbi:GIY-YIG nuclease family protein [Mycobacterium sp. UM_CSW]|uniref:GIY-YIG nuclease family protein n=1 Tax=Mycobacterium sp. UM_CSW TaxID=1370119 RepID=UPI0008348BD3|nr:GIY-YIG nuclease family protein [Mycobacterium sp. UM_CSW]
MAVDKDLILIRIRELAAASGGKPPGRQRFVAETGISDSSWRGRYWVTWSEAVAEAGFSPNAMNARKVDDDGLLLQMAIVTRKLGRFPTDAHLRMERHNNPEFPSEKVFANRLGKKANQVARLRAFVQSTKGFADVLEILTDELVDDEAVTPIAPDDGHGYVYMIRSGKYCKVGHASHVGRREYEVGLQLPERVELVHSFATDDPAGIERYWHQRFSDRRRNGEWFLLTAADVAAFKRRRKFM